MGEALRISCVLETFVSKNVTISMNVNQSESESFKIFMVGAGAVGKTTLTLQFITGKFVEEYEPNYDDRYKKYINIENEKILFEIIDDCNPNAVDNYSFWFDNMIRLSNAILLIYSITSQSSFEEINYHYNKICRIKEDNYKLSNENILEFPIILIGNKCDLADEYRQVSINNGQQLANKLSIPFFETSAKTQINSFECFYECLRIHKTLSKGNSDYGKDKYNEKNENIIRCCYIL